MQNNLEVFIKQQVSIFGIKGIEKCYQIQYFSFNAVFSNIKAWLARSAFCFPAFSCMYNIVHNSNIVNTCLRMLIEVCESLPTMVILLSLRILTFRESLK